MMLVLQPVIETSFLFLLLFCFVLHLKLAQEASIKIY